jgi:hypothetical protein
MTIDILDIVSRDIVDTWLDGVTGPIGASDSLFTSLAGAVGAVGNVGGLSAGVFQVLWEGAASSRLSIGRQLP